MNPDGYEARVIGKDKYLEIAKRHNLTTKEHTYGRLKEFEREIKEEVNEKLNKDKKKRIFKFRKRNKR